MFNTNNQQPRLTPEEAEVQRQKALTLRHTNPIVQAKINEMHSLINRAVDGFDPEKLREENAIFPEKLFRACGFMDYFFGVVQDSKEYDFENKWIAIAGSATSEVNIIDERGGVLFIVPPLYDTSYLRIANYRRDDMISEITQHYESRNGSPHQANQYLGDALEAKLRNIIADKSKDAPKHQLMLEKMYAYYNKRPVGSGPGGSQAAGGKDSTYVADDFDYE